MDIFLDQHKNFLLLLLKHGVDFIVIGGYAVIIYGYERGTSDMDIWLKPGEINQNKLANALREYGIMEEDISKILKIDFHNASAFHIGEEPVKIDFLTKIIGVTYDEADKQKIFLPLKDQQIPVIHYHHLVTNKLLSNRLKDKADVEELQKINRFRKKQ